MNYIKTWEDRITACGRTFGGHGGGEPCGLSNIFCSECRNKAKDAEIEEYRALAARATPAQPVPMSALIMKANAEYLRSFLVADEYEAFDRATASAIAGLVTCGKSLVPKGHKLVPLEPTEAMIHAAEDIEPPRPFGKVYRAMIAAAPSLTSDVSAPSPSSVGAANRLQKIYCTPTEHEGRIVYEHTDAPIPLSDFFVVYSSEATELAEQVQGRQVQVTHDRLQNWIDVIHDNERSMGDRLQSLSSKFQGLLKGDAVDKYPLSTIREQRADLDWMPIETAPKGENAILAIAPGYDPAVVRWRAGMWMTADMEADFEDDELEPCEWKLAYWMPLPAAPSIPQDGQKSEGDHGA